MSNERVFKPMSGWGMLVLNVLLYPALAAGFIGTAVNLDQHDLDPLVGVPLLLGILLCLVGNIILSIGFMILAPNQAGVLVLFGRYIGTVKVNGFWWVNPFASKRKVSLRAHNLNSDKLKVNDRRGNPIEIAAVVVWRVQDTAQAAFDVEDYESYVQVQAESAIRSIASLYDYDHGEEHEVTLRNGGDEVAAELTKELQARLHKAGVVVDEARITHLAYAPEIAQAMLRRQQAEAVIAARQKIVHGAVSMVEMALQDLAAKEVVKLDEERKAAMVSNLLVVLCSETASTPVINTGTLYS